MMHFCLSFFLKLFFQTTHPDMKSAEKIGDLQANSASRSHLPSEALVRHQPRYQPMGKCLAGSGRGGVGEHVL